MKRKEYKHITVWSEDDYPGIIFGQYVPKLVVDLSIAQELVNDRLDFSGGEPIYVLIDFSNVQSVTKEARDYMNNPEGGLKGILGGAFLSNNSLATLFVNLYFKINKPTIPSRFFTKKSEALEWLANLKAEKTV